MLLLPQKRLLWQYRLAETGRVDTESSTSPLTPVGIWPGPPTGTAAQHTSRSFLMSHSEQAGAGACKEREAGIGRKEAFLPTT